MELKRIHYNNWVAKKFLFNDYTTIMLFGNILTKGKYVTQDTERHESTHVYQYFECLILGLFIIAPLTIWHSIWWVFLVPFFYYILYLGEWFISFLYRLLFKNNGDAGEVNHKSYKAGALEMEAEYYESHVTEFYGKRKYFGWFKYYGKI